MKRKKHSSQDDERDEERGDSAEQNVLETLVCHEKVAAFMENYIPTDDQCTASKVFNDDKLRTYFGAYPVPQIGDPLPLYTRILAQNGFKMHTSWSGEPAIFVRTPECKHSFSEAQEIVDEEETEAADFYYNPDDDDEE